MSYLRQRKNKKKKIFIIATVSVFFVLLTVSFYINHSVFSGAAHSIGGPFWRVTGGISEKVSPAFSFFSSRAGLVSENEELKRKIEEMERDSLDKHALKFENRELREMLEMRPKEGSVMSYVLARPPRVPYDVLVIDGGRNDGFSVGDKVFFGESVILGEIREVYRKTSLVVLYSSSGEDVDVYVEDGESILVAKGRGGGKFVLEAPRNSEISEGDYIFNTGDRVSLLAKVVAVDIPETGALKLVTAGTPVDIFSVRIVFVVPGVEI